MKLSSRKHLGSKLELATAGMIDVVFLLLIFFLVTASFLPPEKELRPAIETEKKNASGASDLEKAIVEIIEGIWGLNFGASNRTVESKFPRT